MEVVSIVEVGKKVEGVFFLVKKWITVIRKVEKGYN